LYADEVLAAVRFDIRQLKEQMEQALDPADLQHLLAHAGVRRGPSLQGIAAVHQGDRQQLVHFKLPTAMESSRQDFVLHPSLLDSALQAAIALITDPDRTPARPLLAPVALDSLRIFAPCAGEMYAWVRYARGSRAADLTLRLDIDLMDAQGAVCASFRSLAFDNEEYHEAARSDFELLLDSIGDTGARVPQPEEAEDYAKVFDKLLQDIKA
jgi:acyl transferase domain-containing protein